MSEILLKTTYFAVFIHVSNQFSTTDDLKTDSE